MNLTRRILTDQTSRPTCHDCSNSTSSVNKLYLRAEISLLFFDFCASKRAFNYFQGILAIFSNDRKNKQTNKNPKNKECLIRVRKQASSALPTMKANYSQRALAEYDLQANLGSQKFKSHFLRISRIERHSEKIELFFILPKHLFG